MSYCCDHCFNDEFLQDKIRKLESAGPGKCDFCEQDSDYRINPIQLKDYFLPLLKLYERQSTCMSLDLDDYYQNARMLFEVISEDWDIFSIDDFDKRGELAKAIVDGSDLDIDAYEYVLLEGDYFDYEQEAWDDLCKKIIENNGYSQQQMGLLHKFLRPYLKVTKIKKGDVFYRARKGCTEYNQPLQPDEMGKPPDKKAMENRVSPKGVSYLYLSSDGATAFAEIKPYKGNRVTIGSFSVEQDLTLVDFTCPTFYDKSPFEYGEELENAKEANRMLRAIDLHFSMPVDPNESRLDYVPTQCMCKFVKDDGYHGVIYRSSLACGHNVVLFDGGDNQVKCKKTDLYKLNSISYDTHPPFAGA